MTLADVVVTITQLTKYLS